MQINITYDQADNQLPTGFKTCVQAAVAPSTGNDAFLENTNLGVLPTISIGTIAGDDRINSLEATQSVAIGGTTTSVENGQLVRVTIVDGSGHTVDTLSATVANNAWTTNLTATQANALVGNVYTVKADVSDFAGTPASEATLKINQTPVNLYFTGRVSDDWTQNIIDQSSQGIVYTNWTGTATPHSGDNVEIGPGSPNTTVVIGSNVYQHTSVPLVVNALILDSGFTLDQAAGPLTIGSLLSNSGTINVTAGPLVVSGEIANAGQISFTNSELELSGTVVLDGAGGLKMSVNPNPNGYNNDLITGSNVNTVATLENFSTIAGIGLIGSDGDTSNHFAAPLVVHNHGIIDATDNAQQLVLRTTFVSSANALTNDGTLMDTGQAGLVIFQTNVIQTSQGVIGAFGAGTHVDLAGVVIDGGIIDGSGGGVVRTGTMGGNFGGVNKLDGSTAAGAVNNIGALLVADQTSLVLKGAIRNTGTMTLHSTGHGADLEVAAGDATLTGHGNVTLETLANDYNYNNITGTSTTVRTTLHNVDNNISGSGVIGTLGGFGGPGYLLALDNQAAGIIDATDNAGNQLSIATGATVENAGVLEATGTAGLLIQGDTVDQNPNLNQVTGDIGATGAGTHVDLAGGATIQGGSLITANGGVIDTGAGGGTLDGSTSAGAVTNLGTVDAGGLVGGGGPLTLVGSIVNRAVITVRPGMDLQIGSGGSTLTGGGSVTLQRTTGDYNNADITGSSTTVRTTLHNVDNTISGAGAIGPGAYKSAYLLAIDNQAAGVIEATNNTGPLTLQTGATIVNNGTLEGNGGELSVSDAVSGTGHATITAGGSIQFAGDFQENTAFAGAGSLTLADAYSGIVSGFAVGDSIDLSFLPADATDTKVYTPNGSGTGGTLTILNAGGQKLATLQLSGAYSGSSQFTLGHDSQNRMVVTTSVSAGPTITGAVAGQVTNDKSPISPFAGMIIGNVANPAQVEAVTVTLDHPADGILSTASGFTLTSPGVYSFSGTAAAATAAIDALVFTPTAHQVAPGSAVTTDFTVAVNDGHGGTASNATTTVVATAGLPPTSAALIQESTGALDYLEFAGSNLVGSDEVSQYGWKIVAEGDFNHDGRTDLVTQNPNSGAIDLLFLQNGALQGSLLEQGNYLKVVGAGDFDGSGRTGIATQSASGQIDLLWFAGAQLTGSELLNGNYQPVVGAADFNGDGKTDLVTQSQGGGPLDFLFFNGSNLSGSAQTSQWLPSVHDATNTGVAGQSVLLSQIPGSGQVDYLQFNGTSLTGSALESPYLGGNGVLPGTQVAAQFFSH